LFFGGRTPLVLGDTDDTSIHRDTKISRYWYRACLNTFWYRDTKSIAILFDTFYRYCTWQNLLIRCFGNSVTLMVSVTLACMYQCVCILYFWYTNTKCKCTISLIKFKLSIIILVLKYFAHFTRAITHMIGP